MDYCFLLYFCLIFLLAKKTKGAFIRAFIYLFSVALPTIYSGKFVGMVVYGFSIGVVLGFFIVYFSVYKKAIRKIAEFDDKDEDLEFFNLLMNGYSEFKNKIKEKMKILEKKQQKYNKTYLKIHEELKKSLPSFIVKIYAKMHKKNDDFTVYATYVMVTFISDFFSNSNARFTLRVIDKSKIQW